MNRRSALMLSVSFLAIFLMVSVCRAESGKVAEVMEQYQSAPSESSSASMAPGLEQLDEKAYRTNILLIKLKYVLAIILIVSWVTTIVIVLRRFGVHSGIDPFHAITTIGLLSVIHGTIIIMMMANTDQQLTAPIGIMGAIAGYLFGRRGAASDKKSGAGDPEK